MVVYWYIFYIHTHRSIETCMHTSHSLYSTCSYYHLVNCCSPSYTIHIHIYIYMYMPKSYLKMKINSISSMQKVATLSIVFIRTTSCRLSAGMNLTSLMTLKSLNVLSTDRPPSAWPMISHTLGWVHTCLKRRGKMRMAKMWWNL